MWFSSLASRDVRNKLNEMATLLHDIARSGPMARSPRREGNCSMNQRHAKPTSNGNQSDARIISEFSEGLRKFGDQALALPSFFGREIVNRILMGLISIARSRPTNKHRSATQMA